MSDGKKRMFNMVCTIFFRYQESSFLLRIISMQGLYYSVSRCSFEVKVQVRTMLSTSVSLRISAGKGA